MTNLRGEKVDEGKVWAACPNCATLRERVERAERTLLRAGFADNQGEEWKPPVNTEAGMKWKKLFTLEDENAALRARVKVLESALDWVETCGFGWADVCVWRSEIIRRRAGEGEK